LNRKIAISAVIVAFVAGMFFAGTPVEAKKGGGGAVIDEILVAITDLDLRVTALENDPIIGDFVIDASGGDCSSIGTWQPRNIVGGFINDATCFIETDIEGTITVISPDIAVDGQNHLVLGDTTTNGIFLDQPADGVTIRNFVLENHFRGIYSQNGLGIVIIDNIIRNSGEAGIEVGNSAAYPVISKNSINEPLRYGIKLENVQRAVISDNSIENSNLTAIFTTRSD
jgi:parallel beta-helix repeat protein